MNIALKEVATANAVNLQKSREASYKKWVYVYTEKTMMLCTICGAKIKVKETNAGLLLEALNVFNETSLTRCRPI